MLSRDEKALSVNDIAGINIYMRLSRTGQGMDARPDLALRSDPRAVRNGNAGLSQKA